jgi:translocation and assembly module TamA
MKPTSDKRVADTSPPPFIRGLLWLLLSALTPVVSAATSVEVVISGLKGEMLSNALGYLSLYQQRDNANLDATLIAELHREAPQQIADSLKPFGYFNPSIEGDLQQTESGFTARYQVEPGQPVRVKTVDVRWRGPGKDDAQLQKLLARFPAKPGEPLQQAAYDKAKTKLLERAARRGYPEAKAVQHRIEVDLKDNSAAILLHLDTGPLIRFGEVRVKQDFLDPQLVAGFIDLKPGMRFSPKLLLGMEEDLSQSDYFSGIDIHPRFEQLQDARLPVDVTLTPAKRHHLSAGLGFDTDTGLRATAGWKSRFLNRKGHHSDLNLKLAEKEGSLKGVYWIPGANPRNDKWAIGGGLEYEDVQDHDSETAYATLSYLFKWGDWYPSPFVSYRYERFNAGLQDDATSNLLLFGIGVDRTEIDDKKFHQQGYQIIADVQGDPGLIDAEVPLLRGHLFGRYLLPLNAKHRLNLRGELGGAWVDADDLAKYPVSLRYYAGGDQSVRGYDYKSLGPSDASGQVIGGKNLLVGSIQYDYRLYPDWVIELFADAGNAFNDSLEHIAVGAGFGVKWLSPIGPAYLELAWPLNKQDDALTFSDVAFHVGFGASIHHLH